MYMTGLVPARFLMLIFHLVLTAVVLIGRNDNVLSCLRRNYTQLEFDSLNIQIIVATVVSFVLFILEFIAFIFAFSITNQWQSLFSILCHCVGVITLSYYVFDGWCCSYYWYIFAFCCIPPAVTELGVWICDLCIKKRM